MGYSMAELNQMTQDAFVGAVGDVFEHTPSIAAQAWMKRPFVDLADLHQKMVEVMTHLSPAEQLALIRAHPDLGSKTKMADASVKEQSGVGLDRLTADEFERFQQLNRAYKTRFGFPFIIAVKRQTKASILAAFDRRLQHSVDIEVQQALAEIAQIAWFRLLDLVEAQDVET